MALWCLIMWNTSTFIMVVILDVNTAIFICVLLSESTCSQSDNHGLFWVRTSLMDELLVMLLALYRSFRVECVLCCSCILLSYTCQRVRSLVGARWSWDLAPNTCINTTALLRIWSMSRSRLFTSMLESGSLCCQYCCLWSLIDLVLREDRLLLRWWLEDMILTPRPQRRLILFQPHHPVWRFAQR